MNYFYVILSIFEKNGFWEFVELMLSINFLHRTESCRMLQAS